MKGELKTLQQAMGALTNASVVSVLHKIINYATRPLAEFSKYEGLEMVENLKNASEDKKHPKDGYYRLVYQTLRGKMEISNEH